MTGPWRTRSTTPTGWRDGAADRSFVLRGADAPSVERSVRIDIGDGYPSPRPTRPEARAFAAFEPMTAPINALVSGDHR